jgi:hypothetical protein
LAALACGGEVIGTPDNPAVERPVTWILRVDTPRHGVVEQGLGSWPTAYPKRAWQIVERLLSVSPVLRDEWCEWQVTVEDSFAHRGYRAAPDGRMFEKTGDAA